MLCYTIGLLMMLRHVRTMNLPLRAAARARPFHHALRRLPPVATFGRMLSSKRHEVPSMVEAAVANGRTEAEQHTFFNGKVATTVLAAEPPEPATIVPPEDAPARCIDTREEARRVVEVLMRHSTPDRVHAVDTEVMGLDLKKSPLGQGHVTCVSVYSGPDVDFGGDPDPGHNRDPGPGHNLDPGPDPLPSHSSSPGPDPSPHPSPRSSLSPSHAHPTLTLTLTLTLTRRPGRGAVVRHARHGQRRAR